MRSGDVLKACSHWTAREDLSDAFMRLVDTTPDSDSDLAECLATASGIDIENEDSWYRAWAGMGDRASAAAEAGRADACKIHWLRAINYYQAAGCAFDDSDPRKHVMLGRMRSCAQAFLRQADPPGEVVTIPWRADYSLQGYFIPAPATQGAAPAVLCFSEPGQYKEVQLLPLARAAANRGLSLLCVDLLGAGAADCFGDIAGSRDLESSVGSAMDYLCSREDVDEDRIAVLANDWGSSFVARAIGFDQRYAAAVCDAGLWDMHERAFLTRRLAAGDASMASAIGASRVARHIMCPVLIAMREQGWLDPDHATQLVSQMKADHPDILLKTFPGRADDVKGRQPLDAFVFDWIAARLSRGRRLRS